MTVCHDILQQQTGALLAQVKVEVEQRCVGGVALVASRKLKAVAVVERLDPFCVEIGSLFDDQVDCGLNFLERCKVEIPIQEIAKALHEPAIQGIEIVLSDHTANLIQVQFFVDEILDIFDYAAVENVESLSGNRLDAVQLRGQRQQTLVRDGFEKLALGRVAESSLPDGLDERLPARVRVRIRESRQECLEILRGNRTGLTENAPESGRSAIGQSIPLL